MKYGMQMLMVGLGVLILLGCEKKFPPGFLASGTLEATEVRVSTLTGGIVLEFTKQEGDPVSEGELLASVHPEIG